MNLTVLGKGAKLNSVYVFILPGMLDRTNTTTLPYAEPLCYAHLSWTAKSIATIGFIGNCLLETSLYNLKHGAANGDNSKLNICI